MVISALLMTKFGPNHISLPKILPLCWKFYQPLPDGMYLLKVNNRNRRRRSKISSKFTKKHQNDVFIINFEHISHLVLVFLLLTLSRQMPAGVSAAEFPAIGRSSHWRSSVKKRCSKNFTGKHLCWSIFLIKLHVWSTATLLNRESNTDVFLWNFGNFKEHPF